VSIGSAQSVLAEFRRRGHKGARRALPRESNHPETPRAGWRRAVPVGTLLGPVPPRRVRTLSGRFVPSLMSWTDGVDAAARRRASSSRPSCATMSHRPAAAAPIRASARASSTLAGFPERIGSEGTSLGCRDRRRPWRGSTSSRRRRTSSNLAARSRSPTSIAALIAPRRAPSGSGGTARTPSPTVANPPRPGGRFTTFRRHFAAFRRVFDSRCRRRRGACTVRPAGGTYPTRASADGRGA